MYSKRPVDIKRDSGGHDDIGSEEDGAITTTIVLDTYMLIVKTKAIYRYETADNTDSERQNPELPPFLQRRILKIGSDSELVSRILLTAKKLFKKEHLLDSINVIRALELSMEALLEVNMMQSIAEEHKHIEYQAIVEFEGRNSQSTSIPAIGDISTRCKTFFQKADHATQVLMEIIMLFNPNFKAHPQAHFQTFRDFLKKEYGDENRFTMFLYETLPFFRLIRNIRNYLEHRNPKKEVNILDFELQVDGNILPPTIEVDFNETKLDREPLTMFLFDTIDNMQVVFETMFAYLCDYNIRSRVLPVQVTFHPKELRRNQYINYTYWYPTLGKDGFYEP